MKPRLLTLLTVLLLVLVVYVSTMSQTPVIGIGNSGSSDGQSPGTTNAVGVQGFDNTANSWTRARMSTTSLAGRPANEYLAGVPHLHDGNNADPMESSFLIQQQGNGGQTSNSGEGIVPLLGFDDNLETYNLLGSSTRTGLKTASAFEYNADVWTRTYTANRQLDAAAAGDFLNVNAGTNRSVHFQQLIITSEVAAQQLDVFVTSAAGATCTAVTPGNMNPQGGASDATANHTCTSDPTTASTVARVNLAAGIPFLLDLRGFHANAASGDGLSVNLVTTPGAGNNVSVTLTWRECAGAVIC